MGDIMIANIGEFANRISDATGDEEWVDGGSNVIIEVNGQTRYVEEVRLDERTDSVVIVAGRIAVP